MDNNLRLADCCRIPAVMSAVEVIEDTRVVSNSVVRPPKPWHSYIAFAVALIICAWFVSWGDWKFFQHDALASYYDAQALSILNGHLDVPREAIGFEAYIYNGKAYGYFGIAP